ncbi:MAG: 3-methyl-2-oxobutanoate hydroxymethyltransferase [Gammaproteobacteria bacterium]|nr:3-methyl-2-oxobutanoate hydroxymethyltransferase [Gammaproteobacteria bacterium]
MSTSPYQGTANSAPIKRTVTVKTLRDMKSSGEKIAALTAYDASFAALLDDVGVDIQLVGDSLGNVIQGLDSTLPVSVDDMIYHARAVATQCRHGLRMVDMPFMSYWSIDTALQNAARLMKEGGAQMVKLECTQAQEAIIRALVNEGIPVCAHLGLRPQSVHKLGGYRVQGRDAAAAEAMLIEAQRLQDAGADVLLLEAVPASLAAQITQQVEVPVIGIGAGSDCDGQVLVLYDILAITPGKRPKFSKDFLANGGDIRAAIQTYVNDVKAKRFPSSEHSFT